MNIENLIRGEGMVLLINGSPHRTGSTYTALSEVARELEAEGIKMTCSNSDVVELGLSVASGKMKYEDILDWIKKHEK